MSPQTLEEFRRICQDAGLKVTPQRLEIFRKITAARDHPSAEEVHDRVKEQMPSVSLDTVYRTLATLDHYGVVVKMQGQDGRSRFDGNAEPHHHLVCKGCGAIQDFKWPALDALRPPASTKAWGEVDLKQVELRGLCAECLKAGGKD